MIEILKKWLMKRTQTTTQRRPVNTRKTGAQPVAQPEYSSQMSTPLTFTAEDDLQAPEIEDAGPGKSVLIRNKYVREDTGTHETLMILDDSLVDSDEEAGIDPYNTGSFDRSKNWNNRFRK